jgi:beta-glucosidase
VRDWVNYRRGQPVFEPFMQQLTANMAAMFGGGDSGEGGDNAGGIGMELQGFILEMPLLSLLEFQEGALPRPAAEIVDDLLKQVHAL